MFIILVLMLSLLSEHIKQFFSIFDFPIRHALDYESNYYVFCNTAQVYYLLC